MLNLFYKEPSTDRWLPGDRYPRHAIRRLIRGPRRPGGQERVFLNLKAGLDRLGIPYRDNNFSWARRNPDAPVGIIGKPHVLDHHVWTNPILFGASIMSHPFTDIDVIKQHPIKRVLVPGEWMRKMFEPHWGDIVHAWPVGIDSELWRPSKSEKEYEVLLYNKIRWRHAEFEESLLGPIRHCLSSRSLSSIEFRYGHYKEEDFHAALKKCRVMIFICEHETQGIAYQQALSCGVPIYAWDRGGYWQDPLFFPDQVKFEPVSSVPYWDERCGEKFSDFDKFNAGFDQFIDNARAEQFSPRDYILENLTLEKSAQQYREQWKETFGE